MTISNLLKQIKEKEIKDDELKNEYLTYESQFLFSHESLKHFYFKDSYYIGELNDNSQFEGFGTLIKDHIRYDGFFVDGRLIGIVRIFFNNKNIEYFKFKNGELANYFEISRFEKCKNLSGLKSSYCVIM